MFRNASDAQFVPMKGVFSSGLIDNIQNEDIPDKNSPYIRNARIDGFGTKIRAGYVQQSTCPSYPVTHLGYWNMKDSSGADKNLLVYTQNNDLSTLFGQVGFYDITGDACINALSKTKAYWLGPITNSFSGTLGLYYKPVKLIAELGGFSPIVVADTNGNIVQQFDLSDIDSVEQFQKFQLNYADQDFTHWKLITNGIIHADFGDGIIRDMVLNFGSVVDMVGVDTIFAQALIDLVAYTYNGVTTGYIKVNGADVGPINLSTASSVEDVSTIINTAAGYTLTYIRYGVNDSGENVPYMVFQKTDLATVDRTTTGQGELLWELLGGDPLAATQFYPERLQTVCLNTTDTTIYSSSSADSYYLYSVGVDAGGDQDGFFVLDNDFKQRLSLKPNGVRPKLGVIFDSFHFIAGDTRNASNMYQSVRSYYEDFESPGSDKYTFDGPITAMKTNNKELYIFTKNSIGLLQAGGFTSQGGIYRYNIQQLETQEGALSQAGVVAVGNRIFFWTPSNKIRVVGRDAEGLYDVADLSHRVGNGIDLTMQYAINADQSKMFGIYIPNENIIKWICRSAAGSYNDMAIIYDIEHDTWLVDTYARTYFYHGAQDAKNAYLTGRVVGSATTVPLKIYKDSSGALDDTVAYSWIVHTKRWMFGDPTLQKQFWGGRLFLDMSPGATTEMQIWIDGAKVYEVNLTTATASNTSGNRVLDPNIWEYCYTISKGMLRAKGKNIQFKFVNSGSGSQLTIKGLSLQVLGLPLETSNTNNSK